jgi:hypothetical protein
MSALVRRDPLFEKDLARRLFLLYLLTWVLEGALRKWVFPGQQQLVYFLRVPIVLAIVVNSLRCRGARIPMAGAVGVALVAGLIAFEGFAIMLSGSPLTTAALGLRLYLEPCLVPLCLASDLKRDDIFDALRLICRLSLPLGVLALLQVNSSSSSYVNRIFASDGSDNFGLAGTSIRATSSFSSSAGHASFAVLAVGAAVALYLAPSKRKDLSISVVGGFAAAVMVITAGSRSAILGSLLPLVVLFITIGYRHPERLPKFFVGAVVIAILGFSAGQSFAPRQIEGVTARFSYTGAGSELNHRSLGAFTDWTGRIPDAPLMGGGLGASVQGLAATGSSQDLIEGELVRQLFELGLPLFLFALALRIAAVIFLIIGALRCLNFFQDSMPLVILGVGLPSIAVGPATGQGTISGFVAVVVTIIVASFTAVPSQASEQLAIKPRVLQRQGRMLHVKKGD